MRSHLNKPKITRLPLFQLIHHYHRSMCELPVVSGPCEALYSRFWTTILTQDAVKNSSMEDAVEIPINSKLWLHVLKPVTRIHRYKPLKISKEYNLFSSFYCGMSTIWTWTWTLFYNDWQTTSTTYISISRWHGC